ncbi:sarcosine oxidase subunit gamma [Sphingomonas sp.]|uniref:sarcosine oxidase subunit gamma n=1 Tax=Sphingomonas sp. TaxID=28214 RepID=UPI003B00893E
MAEALVVTCRDGLGIAAVMARKGIDAAAIGAALEIEMPRGPRAIFAADRTVIGTGPGTWLLLASPASADHAEVVARTLTGLASVADQSSAYVVQRLSGAGARKLLQRGVGIDLHSDRFGAGSAASTVIAHIGVILWQVDERPTYDIATFRSYASSFRRWLDHTTPTL